MLNNTWGFNPQNFPIDALPPLLRQAVYEVSDNIQAPVPLIVSSALGAVSMALQNTFNVRRPNGLESPPSLFIVVSAESGERKSTTDKLFTKAILEIEQDADEKYKCEELKYKVDLFAWRVRERILTKALCQNEDENDINSNSRIAEHIANKPEPPKKIRLIYDDATTSAIKFGLNRNWKSIGVISAEGGIVLGGNAMSDLAMYNE